MKKSLDWSKELGAQEDALVKHNTNGQHGQWQILEKNSMGINQAGADVNMAKKEDEKKDKKHDFDKDGKLDEHEEHHKKLDEKCDD